MTARACPPARTPAWTTLGLAVLFLGAVTGAASAPLAIPSDLPNRTDQGEFHCRWALVREPGAVRAVGLAEAPTRVVAWVRVALFGVDRDGRVVSRGETEIAGGFGRSILPFEVALHPTGREDRFDLVLLQAHEGKPGD